MDFIKELKNLEITNKNSIMNLRYSLENEKNILDKKIFAFKFIEFANEINSLLNIEKPNFNEKWKFYIGYYYSAFNGEYKVAFRIKDEGTYDNHIVDNEISNKLDKITNSYTQHCNAELITREYFEKNYISENISQANWKELDLSTDISEQILNIFLNDEIKKSLEYSQMQLGLKENQVSTKKVKM